MEKTQKGEWEGVGGGPLFLKVRFPMPDKPPGPKSMIWVTWVEVAKEGEG